MKTKKYIISVIICIWMLISLGCEVREEEKTEISFIHGWGSTETEHAAMRKIYLDFEKENPDIKLNMVSMPAPTDVVNKVRDLLTVGEIPDIIFTAGDGRESIYKFMLDKKYALDLLPYINKDEEFKSRISPIILDNWTTENGKLYTVSDVLLVCGGYWYNRDIFKKVGINSPPLDREKWIQTCKKINYYGGKISIKSAILDSNQIVYLTDAILADEAPDLIRNLSDKKINLNSLGFRRTLLELERISRSTEIVNSFNYRDALASFNEGETAIYINGVWASSMINKNIDAGYAPLPSGNGKGISAVSSGIGYILGDTKDEKRIEASIKFLKYMLSDKVAKRILVETGQIPSNPLMHITEENAGKRLYEAVNQINSAEYNIEAPPNIWGTTKKDEYGDNIILYLKNKLTLKELQNRMAD